MGALKVAEKYKIGEIFINKQGCKFIIEDVIKNSRRIIRFIDTGYVCEVSTKSIKNKYVVDRLYPSVAGVGKVGYIDNATKHPLYKRWCHMIDRCYNPKCARYKYYGLTGVTICERWHRFDYYVEDVQSMDNCEKIFSDNWQIDKDLSNSKYYSKDTCIIISQAENIGDKNTRNSSKEVYQLYNGEIINVFPSATDAENTLGLKRNRIASCCRKRIECMGYNWIYKEDFHNETRGNV